MAGWVHVNEPFDWRAPNERAMKSFPPGDYFMNDDQIAELKRQGKGREIAKPDGARSSKG